MRRFLAALVITTTLILMQAVPAGAGDTTGPTDRSRPGSLAKPVRLATTIVVNASASGGGLATVRGRVKAREQACTRGRSVRMHAQVANRRIPVGRDRTGSLGRWRITPRGLPISAWPLWVEFTVTRKKIQRKHRRNIVCRAARLRAVPLGSVELEVTPDGSGGLAATTSMYVMNPKCGPGRRVVLRNLTTKRRVAAGTVTLVGDSAIGPWTWSREIDASQNSPQDRYRARIPATEVRIRGKRVRCLSDRATWPVTGR